MAQLEPCLSDLRRDTADTSTTAKLLDACSRTCRGIIALPITSERFSPSVVPPIPVEFPFSILLAVRHSHEGILARTCAIRNVKPYVPYISAATNRATRKRTLSSRGDLLLLLCFLITRTKDLYSAALPRAALSSISVKRISRRSMGDRIDKIPDHPRQIHDVKTRCPNRSLY